MKALIFKGPGSIALETVDDPHIQNETDVIVQLTTSAICGTDLHIIRGTIPGVLPGTILGHEGVGIIESLGSRVQNFAIGDRVIIPSTVGCGVCDYCKQEIYAQCDVSNSKGADAGTVFFGGPVTADSLAGMQAEKVRVPYADANLIKIPDGVTDQQAILLSDILPTAYMAVELADISEHDSVAVFGCGPVGQLVIACLKQRGVEKIFAIDAVPSRLHMAQKQGAQIINFDIQDPVKTLKNMTDDKGPTKIIDAVGIDAEQPKESFIGFFKNFNKRRMFKKEVSAVAPITNIFGKNWIPGNGPSQVLQWAVEAVAKAGTISIIGVYTELLNTFPIGKAMGKNLTLRMGNCNHHKYIPYLLKLVQEGAFDLVPFITQTISLSTIVDAYKHFDRRDEGWLKVVIRLE